MWNLLKYAFSSIVTHWSKACKSDIIPSGLEILFWKVGAKMRIVFMGTPDFAATVLEKLIAAKHTIVLVVSQPDRPVGRKKELLPTPVKKVAMTHQIATFQPERIKLDHQTILDAKPDLIITAAYGQIIPKSLIELPPLGCINVHASLLPKYRGGAPIHQAIIDGQTHTGVTIMYMEETMDTGDVISKVVEPIGEADDVGTMFFKLGQAGAKLLVDTLPSIAAKTNERQGQNHAEATYAYNIKREDERIDWNQPAGAIYNQIRGLNPWPTAYTSINGVNVKVFKSVIFNEATTEACGTILEVSADAITVATKDGVTIGLKELQVAGKKRMEIRDLLNGDHPFKVGEKFDHLGQSIK